MDYRALADLLFPNVTERPEDIEALFPERGLAESAVVTRSAPSPTGFVHLGNLIQGLTSERMAHRSGGVLFLRVEDTDLKREVPGAVGVLINSLAYYGIEYDEGATADGERGDYGPYRQRQRARFYHVFAKELVRRAMAYPCFSTEEELAQIRSRQKELGQNFGYYGEWALWRDREYDEVRRMVDSGAPWVLRFRSQGDPLNKYKFNDLIKGEIVIAENVMDHVLLKSDGIPTYHFAHAVDDHLMRTTHVVRGDEWLPSLPFHLQLFRALGFRAPKYLHIGTLMKMDGASKRKLSKRKDPELALTYFSKEGFPPESVSEYLLNILNSNFEDWRRANPAAPISDFPFSYKKMNPAGSLFDIAKLHDVSRGVISRMSAEDVYTRVLAWAREYCAPFAAALDKERDTAVAALGIGRGGRNPRRDIAVWSEVRGYMGFFFDELFEVTDGYPAEFDPALIRRALRAFLDSYDSGDAQNVWFDKIKTIASDLGFTTDMRAYRAAPQDYPGSVADISMFLRVAVTGRESSPDMYEVMRILGKKRVRERVAAMIDALDK